MHLFSSQIFFNATMTAHKWIFIAFHKEDCKCKRHTYINLHTWKRKVLSTTHIQSFNYKDRRMCVCWMHPKNDIILFSLFSKLKIGFYRRQYFNARSVYFLKPRTTILYYIIVGWFTYNHLQCVHFIQKSALHHPELHNLYVVSSILLP